MIKAIIVASVIPCYSKFFMTEVFFSNVQQSFNLQHYYEIALHHGYHPENCTKFFVMTMVQINCASDCFRKNLIIYNNLPFTGYWETSQKNDSQKSERFELQVIVMRLSFKQPLGMGVWKRYGKELKLAARICLTKCFLITSLTWE